MSKQTTVYVEVQDINTNRWVKVSFGAFSQDEIKKFLANVKRTPYPYIGCINELKISQNKVSIFNFLMPNRNKNNELHIELAPNTIRSECKCLSQQSCPGCILDGNCKNDYVIGLIGKSFAANQYK